MVDSPYIGKVSNLQTSFCEPQRAIANSKHSGGKVAMAMDHQNY